MKLRITPLNWRLLKKVGALQLSLADAPGRGISVSHCTVTFVGQVNVGPV